MKARNKTLIGVCVVLVVVILILTGLLKLDPEGRYEIAGIADATGSAYYEFREGRVLFVHVREDGSVIESETIGTYTNSHGSWVYHSTHDEEFRLLIGIASITFVMPDGVRVEKHHRVFPWKFW